MKKSILCAVGFAVIAALVCVVCNNNSVDEDKKGAAASFLDGFIDADAAYYGLTVEINPAGGGTVSRSPNETRYKAGDAVRVTATVRDGYKFTGWTGASNDTTASVIIIMNSDLTLTANFIPINTTTYTLDISILPVGYGSVSRNPNKTVYTAGELVRATAAANPGYAFVGWSGASNNTTDTVTITMSRDLTLTANFQVGAYTLALTANPTGGGSVSREPDKKTYSYEDEVTVTATAETGYRFTGWSGASTDTAAAVKIIMNDSKALTANFIRQYTVTFSANNGNGAAPNAITADSGSAITLPAGDSLTRSGYTFGGWNTDSAGMKTNYDDASYYTLTADTILYAKWTLNTYTVTFNSQGGNAVYSQVVAHGGSVRSPANPTLDDYIFGGWYKEEACFNSWDFDTDVVTSAITLYAKWNLPYIRVNFYYSGWFACFGSNVTNPSPQTVTVGNSIMLPSGDGVAGTTQTFIGWNTKEDGTGTTYDAGSYFKHPGGYDNISLYGLCTYNTYTVKFDSQGGSAIDSQTVKSYVLVTEPTPPTRDNDVFGGWYKEDTYTTRWNFYRDYVTSPITLYAKWMYTVTFNSQSGSSVSSQTIDHGRKITKPTVPTRTGYTFGGWYKEDTYTTQWDFDTDVVTSAITLYAKWMCGVTFYSQSNSWVVYQEFDPNGKVTEPPAPTRNGYTFGGWYKEAACTNPWNFDTDVVTSHMTLYAKWWAPYTIWFDANGGTVTPTSDKTADGKLASLPTPKRDGYTFNGWYTAATSGTVVTESREYSADASIYAHWVAIGYTGSYGSVTHGGKTYKTVEIGSQTWFAENLNYDVSGSVCYENSQDSCAKYGRLYIWETAISVCPSGWHLPHDAEWTELMDAVGGEMTAGNKLKATSGWYETYTNIDSNGSDDYGFSALPGGQGFDGDFSMAGRGGLWWTATERSLYANNAGVFSMLSSISHTSLGRGEKSATISVRCVQD